MKKRTIILIILGICFTFLPISVNNPRINPNEFELDNLKASTISGKIHIDGDSGWAAFKTAANCTGNGTFSDPYVIENLEIDGENSGTCILIENSTVYFRIENCNLYNAGDFPAAGIILNNTKNGYLIDNICSPNFSGISLYNSHNNTISGNIANDNEFYGILVTGCANNTILGNTINNNVHGISLNLGGAINNDIRENTLINNGIGIQAWHAIINNNISRNLISKSDCGIKIESTADYNNTLYLNCFTDNGLHVLDNGLNYWDNGTVGNYWDNYTGSDSNTDGIGDTPHIIAGSARSQDNFPLMECPISIPQTNGKIPGYNLVLLISIISVVAVIINKQIKKTRSFLKDSI